jgi:hypothetical protein
MPAAGSTHIEASFVGRRLIGSPGACAHRGDAAAADRTSYQRLRSCVMLTNIALWFILAGMFALMPIGCIMTRRPKHTDRV